MAAAVWTACTQALRRRELASVDRAGRYARARAWEYHLGYAKGAWWFLLGIVVGVPALAAPLAMLSDGALRWAIVGASIASGIWLAILYLVVHSGAAPMLMGVAAEEQTVDRLQSLRREGWRYVSGLRLRTEIDHIAVGPPGVLVIETKWSADPWPLGITNGNRFLSARLPDHVAQTRDNAKQVRLHSVFRRAIAGAPVRAVLVLWSATPAPPGSPDLVEERDVTVVRGPFFRQWVETLEGKHLGREAIEGAWMELSARIERVDDHLDTTVGAQKPTLTQMFHRVFLQAPLGLLASLYVVKGLIALDLPWWGLLLGCLAGLELGLRVRRIPRLRWVASGWMVCWALLGAIFPVSFAIVLLR